MSLRPWNLALSHCAACVAVALLSVPLAHAGIPFQPVSPDELKMTAEPQAPGAPAIILFRQVDRDDNGTTSHEDNYIRIKILTEEGRKNADIEIPFFKETENVINIKARTIRPDGSIADFDGKVFEKSIAKAKGLRYLAKTFTLPDVQVGSIIEYSWTRDFAEYLIFDSHWILSQELFTKRAKFSLKRYVGTYEPAGRDRTAEGGAGPHRPPRSAKYSGLSDGRFHAAGERTEITSRFYLQYRVRIGFGQVLA